MSATIVDQLNIGPEKISKFTPCFRKDKPIKQLIEYNGKTTGNKDSMGQDNELFKANFDAGKGSCSGLPDPGYVVKTADDQGIRIFINICQMDEIGKPSCQKEKGDKTLSHRVSWKVPHGLVDLRNDFAKAGDRCMVYDFIIHPATYRMAETNGAFKKMINKLAVCGVIRQFGVDLDVKSLKFPKMKYKGVSESVEYVRKLGVLNLDGSVVEDYDIEMTKRQEDRLKNATAVSCGVEQGSKCANKIKTSDDKEVETNASVVETAENEFSSIDSCPVLLSDKNTTADEGNGCEEMNTIETGSSEKSPERTENVEEGAKNTQEKHAAPKISGALVKTLDESLSPDVAETYTLPEYTNQQDETTVTFIFAVKEVARDDLSLSALSSQVVSLTMTTTPDNGHPTNYRCCIRFDNGCHFEIDGCHADVSDMNVVLKIDKKIGSRGLWNLYNVGTTLKNLQAKEFLTADNLSKDLDGFDAASAATVDKPGDAGKTVDCVKVTALNEENLVLEIKKAEETELEDVPSDITVVHERFAPRLQSILKQRSVSESSNDDALRWSWSVAAVDRQTSSATGSDEWDESDDGASDGGRSAAARPSFRPLLKKSVSFSERVDRTVYVTNQSVSQMHATLKNKRRRMRKKEQKIELKVARRRRRSSSGSEDSASAVPDDRDGATSEVPVMGSNPDERMDAAEGEAEDDSEGDGDETEATEGMVEGGRYEAATGGNWVDGKSNGDEREMANVNVENDAENVESNEENGENNKENIESNEENRENNKENIESNEENRENNKENLESNEENIEGSTVNIENNKENIENVGDGKREVAKTVRDNETAELESKSNDNSVDNNAGNEKATDNNDNGDEERKEKNENENGSSSCDFENERNAAAEEVNATRTTTISDEDNNVETGKHNDKRNRDYGHLETCVRTCNGNDREEEVNPSYRSYEFASEETGGGDNAAPSPAKEDHLYSKVLRTLPPAGVDLPGLKWPLDEKSDPWNRSASMPMQPPAGSSVEATELLDSEVDLGKVDVVVGGLAERRGIDSERESGMILEWDSATVGENGVKDDDAASEIGSSEP